MFRVQGVTFRVQGLGFRVWGLGFRVWGFGFTVWGLGFRDSLKMLSYFWWLAAFLLGPLRFVSMQDVVSIRVKVEKFGVSTDR